jgi:hypothetical protein
MTDAAVTPDEVLRPTRPLWAINVDEDPLRPTRRQWHAIATDRGREGEWQQFRTRCDRIIGGVMSSIRTEFNEPPADEPTCDECRKALPIQP